MGRRHAMTLLVLAGCGSGYAVKNECNKTFEALCQHGKDCLRVNDIASCELDMKTTQECDLTQPVEAFQKCQENVLAADCVVAEPCVCYAVLCDAYVGCGPVAGTCDTAFVPTNY